MSGLNVLLNIAGGAALLLWAARMVRTGVERAYGSALRRALATAVGGRLRAVLAGGFVTLALQSATATALLAITLISAPALALSSGLALMLGADLGSALAVVVLASGIDAVAPVLLVVGVVLFLTATPRRTKQIGRVFIGLGLLFLSLQLIGTAAESLRDSATIKVILGPLAGEPILAFLVAALFAWGAHSSVATVLFVASLAGAGAMDLSLALALVLGANAGAGLVPVALTLGRAPAERRIPLGNLAFRVLGAFTVLLCLPHLHAQMALLGGTPMQQVVLFHLVFNLALVVFFLPLTPIAARWLEHAVTERLQSDALLTPLGNPSNLDQEVIDNPRLAIASATREVLRLADWVEVMLRRSFEIFESGDKQALAQVAEIDDQIDSMTIAIKNYLIQVSRNKLEEEHSQRCMEIVAFTIKLEHIGDVIEKNLLQIIRKHRNAGARFSAAGWGELSALHENVIANLQLALNAFVSADIQPARQLIVEKERFRKLEKASTEKHMARLRTGTPASIDSSTIHLDVIRDLAQINSLVVSTAYPVLEQSGELLASRLKDIDESEAAAVSPSDARSSTPADPSS